MRHRLTTWEAACIITGYGIGSGVLSMPWIAQRCGILISMVILVIALIASYYLHLMIADLAMKEGRGAQLLSCLDHYLFRGPLKIFMTSLFFLLMLLILCTNLAAYISGASQVITSLLPISEPVASFLFYTAAAVVVLMGLKAVGISEKIAVSLIFALVGILAIASLMNIRNPLTLAGGTAYDALAYYGLAMFAMSAFFSVPQAVEGLDGNPKAIRVAVFLGLLNNFILISLISVCSLLSSKEITEVAMVGWSAGIGLWAQIAGSIFTILAMLTTYWSLSLALGDITADTLHLNRRLGWVLATIPSLLLVCFRAAGFIEWMRIGGGLVAIVIAVMIVPAFHNARKEHPEGGLFRSVGILPEVFIIIAYLLMAVGSVVPV